MFTPDIIQKPRKGPSAFHVMVAAPGKVVGAPITVYSEDKDAVGGDMTMTASFLVKSSG
jgi:hypothetical protein